MGLKDLINKFKGNNSEFKAKLRDAQENERIERVLNERSQSSNERELKKYMENKRQENIKNQLDKIHKTQNSELWKSKNSILAQDTNILKDDRPILHEKNIFLDNKTKVPITNKELFFKW